ncbi:MAG: NADH:ubiquinone reductase (Na(+)-transporting) subunit C [Bacteroidales bacterium]|nr:NADH:ubiquinone reductase (Na(+)-transporting) subunit C [Bacteroidales bacterium]
MKNFSNTYIFVFSAVMVTIVAAVLSFASLKLKPIQDNNIRLEQMQNILASVNIESTSKDATEKFRKYIVESYVINSNAEPQQGVDAFSVDLKKEVSKIDEVKLLSDKLVEQKESPFKKFVSGFTKSKQTDKQKITNEIADINNSRKLPVYICNKDDSTYYVFPLRGKGLWGPIWGYISLKADMNTVYGAVFDHKTETPGLGAEIKETWFQKPFQGKKIFEDGRFTSIKVMKGGAPKGDMHAVDAISGGTITSRGVEYMIQDCLSSYLPFFEQQKK